MNVDTPLSKSPATFMLKGGMFTLTTLQLLSVDFAQLSLQLDEKISQAPHFFHYAPLIIDVARLKESLEAIDFQTLVNLLKGKKLIPIGIRGKLSGTLQDNAILAGLAIFPEDKSALKKTAETPESPLPQNPQGQAVGNTPTRLITQPIRSGQQIYVPGGDLIVLAAVSHGAEVLADGHIHIHGPLRGRALAGVMGNQEAMIFCKSLEAELVSIAGQYRVSEDLKATNWKQAVCIQLHQSRLNIHAV